MDKIATYKTTHYLLNKYNGHAKKGYGQNFIIDYNTVFNIASVGCDSQDCVIEIGPGLGALTQCLAQRAQAVYAFEIDPACIEILGETMKEYGNVKVINHDFLSVDLDYILSMLSNTYGSIKVVSNLPYYITTPLLLKCFESHEKLAQITVMMQKEVALRFTAMVDTKDYNGLTIMAQYLYDASIAFDVSRNVFDPQPNVDSAVVVFKPKPLDPTIIDTQGFFTFVRQCFAQRRKTLTNNLKHSGYDLTKINAWLDHHKPGLTIRSEQLSLDEFKSLYKEVIQ